MKKMICKVVKGVLSYVLDESPDAPKNETLEEHLKHCKAKTHEACPFVKRSLNDEDEVSSEEEEEEEEEENVANYPYYKKILTEKPQVAAAALETAETGVFNKGYYDAIVKMAKSINYHLDKGDAHFNQEAYKSFKDVRDYMFLIMNMHKIAFKFPSMAPFLGKFENSRMSCSAAYGCEEYGAQAIEGLLKPYGGRIPFVPPYPNINATSQIKDNVAASETPGVEGEYSHEAWSHCVPPEDSCHYDYINEKGFTPDYSQTSYGKKMAEVAHEGIVTKKNVPKAVEEKWLSTVFGDWGVNPPPDIAKFCSNHVANFSDMDKQRQACINLVRDTLVDFHLRFPHAHLPKIDYLFVSRCKSPNVAAEFTRASYADKNSLTAICFHCEENKYMIKKHGGEYSYGHKDNRVNADTFRHELAHAIGRGDIHKQWKKFIADTYGYPASKFFGIMKSKVSKYAAVVKLGQANPDIYEAFAETFSKVTSLDYKTGTLPLAIENFMFEKVLGCTKKKA